MTMYHRESYQEGFLVLRGECLVIVDGQELPLKQWDYFHCPADVPHAIVGAGDGHDLARARRRQPRRPRHRSSTRATRRL